MLTTLAPNFSIPRPPKSKQASTIRTNMLSKVVKTPIVST
jgi:hypothetical protein